MRVGVIGAGAAASAFAARLGSKANVTLFEMGRAGGGRLASRGTRSLPGLEIHHGCPCFALTPEAADLVGELAPGGAAPWAGRHATMQQGRVVDQATPERHFVQQALCDKLLAGRDVQFGVQVAGLERTGAGWRLTGKKGEPLGEFDWLVVTSHTLGHPRWKQVFGAEPPLQQALDAAPSPGLQQAVEQCKKTESRPVVVLMFAFADGDASEHCERWRALPWEVLEFEPGENQVLEKCVKQQLNGFTTVVLHSTEAFAAQHLHVHSAKSAVAAHANEAPTGEAEVVAALRAAAEQQLGPLPEAAYGPQMHRWSSAFCGPPAEAAGGPAPLLFPDARLGLCGDFARPLSIPRGHVDAAIRSAVELADQLTAKL